MATKKAAKKPVLTAKPSKKREDVMDGVTISVNGKALGKAKAKRTKGQVSYYDFEMSVADPTATWVAAASKGGVTRVTYEHAKELVTVSPERYQEWSALLGDPSKGLKEAFAGALVRLDPLDAPEDQVRTVRAALLNYGASVRVLPARRADEVPAGAAPAPPEQLPSHREVVMGLAAQVIFAPDKVAECCARLMDEEGI